MTTKTYFVELELSPARENGGVDVLAPTTTVTVLVDSSSGSPHLHLKVVDEDGNTKTFAVGEDEALALYKGLQRAAFYLHHARQPALLM